MNLNSYLSSWWFRDLGETIDEDAHARFMAWMAEPRTVKTSKAYGWRRYTFDMFAADMDMLAKRGDLIKHAMLAIAGTA
jgi:hypothetical protein